jgi:cyclic pyranopterin phosphate synthase
MTEKVPHLNDQGDARMVDVGAKQVTRRAATAEGWIRTAADTLEVIAKGNVEKGAVLGIARIAGIMGAKRTADIIPLCHPLPISGIDLDLELDRELPGVRARAMVRTEARTGVEMEALTAVSSALLTVYDMCKSMDRGMEIGGVRLVRKEGGRSGTWIRESEAS